MGVQHPPVGVGVHSPLELPGPRGKIVMMSRFLELLLVAILKTEGVWRDNPEALIILPLLPITIASLPTTQKHFDWAESDNFILPASVPNHSVGFGSSFPITELAIL